jgi:hypothetical protein
MTDPLKVIEALLARYHAATIIPLLARIALLEKRCDELQRAARRGHRGTYIAGALYEIGEEVALNGSTWRALVDDPKNPPGTGSDKEWQLIAQGRKNHAEH